MAPNESLGRWDVSIDATANLKLHTVNGDRTHYTALSYCWGGPQNNALTQATISQMHELITLASLPQTIQDAIITTRLLGVRFLWVDALCIIQDSDDDKNKELGMMAQVYKNSYVTISAACAKKCYDGFLHLRKPPPEKYGDLTFAYHCSENEPLGTVILTEAHSYNPQLEPVNARAWTYQKRIMAPGLLIYGTSHLRWQCQKMDVSYSGSASNYGEDSKRLNDMFFRWFENEMLHNQAQAFDNWEEVLADYTHRKLSVAADKLIAIAAVASLFTPYCGIYLTARPSNETLEPRSLGYIAPSWSWASVQDTVCTDCPEEKAVAVAVAMVEHCSTVLLVEGFLMGAVTSGLLILRVSFRQCRLRTNGADAVLESTLRDPTLNIGHVFLDANEDRAEDAWCLRLMEEPFGILLMLASDDKYSRVGVVDAIEKKYVEMFES